MENLRSKIENVMFAAGCDMVGVANVERFTGAPEGRRPTDILPTARSVIVGAVHILFSIPSATICLKPDTNTPINFMF